MNDDQNGEKKKGTMMCSKVYVYMWEKTIEMNACNGESTGEPVSRRNIKMIWLKRSRRKKNGHDSNALELTVSKKKNLSAVNMM